MSVVSQSRPVHSIQDQVFDRRLARRVDLVYLALCRSAEDGLLPELLTVFGKEKLIRFIEIFAGSQIKCPPMARLEGATRDATIYADLTEECTQDRIKALARRFRTTEDQVVRVYDEMRDLAMKVC